MKTTRRDMLADILPYKSGSRENQSPINFPQRLPTSVTLARRKGNEGVANGV